MKKKNKNNILTFPTNVTKLERQVEAILFSASEPLDIETIEKRVKTNLNVEKILNEGIDVVCAGLDQDSRGKPWETSSFLLGLSDKITKIYGFCNVCGFEATKTYRKIQGGERTVVGAAEIYEPRCLKHWSPR